MRELRKSWTVLVYMAADNDLQPDALADLREMERPPGEGAAGAAGADVVVQLDRATPGGIVRLHVGPGREAKDALDAAPGTGGIRSPVLLRLAEETLAPGESLRRFLAWGVEAFPAERYAVIVWGHGRGFRPEGSAPGAPGGIALDHTPGNILDIPALRDALAAVSARSLGGRPFDVYASDACLMQSLEVATELAGVARFVVGSEQQEILGGLPYHRLVPAFSGARPSPPPPACPATDLGCHAAATFPAVVRASAEAGEGRTARERATLVEAFTESALDSEALRTRLHPALHHLGAALTAWIREEPLRAVDLREMLRPEAPGAARLPIPIFGEGGRDVGVLLSRLEGLLAREREGEAGPETAASARLSAMLASARAALRATVIAASFGARYTPARFPGIAGVTVWLPASPAELRKHGAFFARSRFFGPPEGASRASWKEWIDLVLAGPLTAPRR